MEEAEIYKGVDLMKKMVLLSNAEKIRKEMLGLIEKTRKKKIAVKEEGKRKCDQSYLVS